MRQLARQWSLAGGGAGLLVLTAAALAATTSASTLPAPTTITTAPPAGEVTTTSLRPLSDYPTVPPFTIAPTTVPADPSSTTTTTVASVARGLLLSDIPLGPEEQAVVDALMDARTAVVEALMDPDAPGLDARLDATHAASGPARGDIEELREARRSSGRRAYVNSSQPWSLTIEGVAFFEEPYALAVVQACYLDTLVAYSPGGGPQGEDVIINDDILVSRLEFHLVPEDTRWQLLATFSMSERYVGLTECPQR
jgi:hypothetical protein